jgi:hypothetical protein
MRICGMIGIFAAAALAAPAAASDEGLLATGLRVRLRTEQVGGWLEGRIVDVTEDSSQGRTLRVAGREGGVLSLPLTSVMRMQISTSSRRRPLKGMLIGAGIGFVLAGVLWADMESCGGCDDAGCAGVAFITAAMVSGAAYGAGIGALIRTPHWQPVAVDRSRVSAAPMGRRSLGVRLALRF